MSLERFPVFVLVLPFPEVPYYLAQYIGLPRVLPSLKNIVVDANGKQNAAFFLILPL